MAGIQEWFEGFFFSQKHKPFPREVLYKVPKVGRVTVEDFEEFFATVWGRSDVFVSVHPLLGQKEHVFERIFLDVDDSDLYLSYFKAKKIAERLEALGLDYWMFFSGKKGFHFYVFTEPVELNNYRGAVLRWLNKVELIQYVDTSVIEPRRVARVPFTRHSATGMFEVPVSSDMNLKSILRRAMVGWGDYVSELQKPTGLVEAEALKELDIQRIEENVKEYVVADVRKIFYSEEMYPPCIRRLIELARMGVNISHDERVLLGSFLIHIMDVDEAMDYFRPLPDFSERETRYQLNYLKSRNMKVLSCKNIANLGLCPVRFKDCPFFPSINYFLRSRE